VYLSDQPHGDEYTHKRGHHGGVKVAPVKWPRNGQRGAERPWLRVEVTNPSDGGVAFWLFKFYSFAALALAAVAVIAAAGAYVHFASTLPRVPPFATFRHEAPITTTVNAWDGMPLAFWAKERRQIVAFEDIPSRLVEAFLAVEDRRFYEHGGLDYRGIARAAVANLRADKVAQGGSTITQQVAKSFLSPERTLERKIREAILARRLENLYSKREILSLYLNQIFLGHGAYGVAAAARRYFDKTLAELSVEEMATIAGLAGAPSRFSPFTSEKLARERRDHVLAAMVAAGYLDEGEANRARAQPLLVKDTPDIFPERSPFFAEHVRRLVAERYGEEALWKGGLSVETTLLPWVDVAAQENVDFSLRKLDKRQGYRGPLARLSESTAEAFRKNAAARYGAAPPAEGRLYLGLVESAGPQGARVRVGETIYELPRAGFEWAFPYSVNNFDNGLPLSPTASPLRRGDVVWVANAHASALPRFSDWTYDEKSEVRYLPPHKDRPQKGAPRLRLEQQPKAQGALLAYDHHTGYVTAMVGGHDPDRTQFNRVVQACRQPGSTYKPVYYSLALDQGYGYRSLLNDIPRAEVDPITGEVWTPTNLNNTVEYQVTLEYALIWSKNVPSVQIFKLCGAREVEAWARRLGFTTPIIADQALALGASCTRLDETTRAFSAFARNGVPTDPVYIRRVRDRHGRVLEDNTSTGDPMGSASERLDRLVALVARKPPAPVIAPRTAWLTSQLLRRVVTHGHAPAMRATQIPFAGKTGTSSATMDTWFVGYTSRWMLTTWIGDDLRQRPLGRKDAAFMLTVPMAARFLHEVKRDQVLEEIPWQRPVGVKKSDTGGDLRTSVEEIEAEERGHDSKARRGS
jgi:penicillin-binding protein 1A